jgi:hypothetical protein
MENILKLIKQYLPLIAVILIVILIVVVVISSCHKKVEFDTDAILGYWGTSPIALATTSQYYFDGDGTFTYYSVEKRIIQKGEWKIKGDYELTLIVYQEAEYAGGDEKDAQDVYPPKGRVRTVSIFEIKNDGEYRVRFDGELFYNIGHKQVKE